MSAQTPVSVTTPCEYAGILGDSEDSDEEPKPEDVLAASWEELSILERLGLHSSEEMTEEEVESAFAQFAMAFRCDQYTLDQRLQAEEHDRTVAEENLQRELEHTKDTLQLLKARCVDSESSEMLMRMEASLETVWSNMDNIISAAEMLGAAHQEARISHAVELMSLHMEHLKRRHAVESAELLETRKLFHRSRGRLHSDTTDDNDIRNIFTRQSSQQHLTRRRVSITLIPTQGQLHDLEAKFLEACKSSENPDTQAQETSSVRQTTRQQVIPMESSPKASPSHVPVATSVQPLPGGFSQGQEEDTDSGGFPSPCPMRLRHRRRSALVEPEEERSGGNQESQETSEHSFSDSLITSESCIPPPEQHHLVSWLSHFQRIPMVFIYTAAFGLLLLVCLFYIRVPLIWL